MSPVNPFERVYCLFARIELQSYQHFNILNVNYLFDFDRETAQLKIDHILYFNLTEHLSRKFFINKSHVQVNGFRLAENVEIMLLCFNKKRESKFCILLTFSI